MRRIVSVFLALLILCALITCVSGATGISNMDAVASVSNDGSCQISLNATIHLEQTTEKLQFPLPKNARNITLNGSRVWTSTSNGVQMVDLSGSLGGVTGDFSIILQYSLSNVLQTTEDGFLQLAIPLLSGFSHPVQSLRFTITLPAKITEKPAFSSGYHQANIEKDLTYKIDGTVITGSSLTTLKDRETLVMTLPVSEADYHASTDISLDADWVQIAMLLCGVLALVYWIFFLRTKLPRVRTCSTGPDGYSAGELRTVLTLQNADLTMMVFSWAQAGYLLIHADRSGRVLLHKRMGMGNERSSFEQRCFQALFRKRETIDTSGVQYAALCKHVASSTANVQPLVRTRSGNPKLFRGLAAMLGLFTGIQLGLSLSAGAALQWPLTIVLALLGLISGWHIQRLATCLFLRDLRTALLGTALSGIWLLLSVLAKQPSMGILLIITQLLAGILAFYGGRRTETGRQLMEQTLGLRRHLRTISKADVAQIYQRNPDYFHTLAPYALALGMDKRFASKFGNHQISDCPYLIANTAGHMRASDWSALMRQTVKHMNKRYYQYPLEKLLGLLTSFTR